MGGAALQIISIMPHFHSVVVPNIRMQSFALPRLLRKCTSACSLACHDFLMYFRIFAIIQGRIATLAPEGLWVVKFSEALELHVDNFDRINTECGEVINALLSSGHSFPVVLIITSFHFNAAVWHHSGNCLSAVVHLSPFLSIGI